MTDLTPQDAVSGLSPSFWYKLMQTWPAKLAQSAYGAVTLPGDVYAGRVAPDSDEAIGRAADMAGLLAGGAPITAERGALGAFGGKPRMGIPANMNVSQKEIIEMIPPPLSRMDRDWQNYGRFMKPDDVLDSEVVWGAGNLGAEQGLGRAESFASAANDLWKRMGANRFITPELARKYMLRQEKSSAGFNPKIVETVNALKNE